MGFADLFKRLTETPIKLGINTKKDPDNDLFNHGLYKKAECCGTDCDQYDMLDNRCAGEVVLVDEIWYKDSDEHYWVHLCEKHEGKI